MIPDEAVEAAWKTYVYSERVGMDTIRNILEAAAPHLMAAAWDEGKDAVWTFMSNSDPRRERPTNPYKEPTNGDD